MHYLHQRLFLTAHPYGCTSVLCGRAVALLHPPPVSYIHIFVFLSLTWNFTGKILSRTERLIVKACHTLRKPLLCCCCWQTFTSVVNAADKSTERGFGKWQAHGGRAEMCKTSCTKCHWEKRWMPQTLHKPRLSAATPWKWILTLEVCRLLRWGTWWHPIHPGPPPTHTRPRLPRFSEPSCPPHALEGTSPGIGHWKASSLFTELRAAISVDKLNSSRTGRL